MSVSVSVSGHLGPVALTPYCPTPGLSARYLPLLPSTHPLRSLGRLVSDTRAVMPLTFGGAAPLFTPNCPQTPFTMSSAPYLSGVLQASKQEEHSPGPLSRFSSPFSHKSPSSLSSSLSSSSSSSSPDKDSKEQTRTYSFTEEDLFTVLYGHCRGQQHSGPQASSGPAPSDTVSDRLLPDIDVEGFEPPEGLMIQQSSYGSVSQYGVFSAQRSIPKGTRFGPFQGRVVNTSEIKTHDDNTLMWEIFENGRLSHFVDGRGSCGNWMSLVRCARFPEEQNLVALQRDGQIYYETCKEIRPHHELLVWYGDCYVQFLGIPLTLRDLYDHSEAAPAEDSGEGYKCDRCGKVFAYKYYRDKHLKYTRCVDQGDRKFPCHLCSRSFEKRDRLRIHILHVHEKHRPHKCSVCGKSFSQSSSLNKHMRVHSGERPYKCVYCSKAFTASSILRTHIRQHSGERPFKCKHCGKAFASHAAHDSHVRRTHATEAQTFSCDVLQEPEELKLHMKIQQSRPVDTAPPSASPLRASFTLGGVTAISPEYRPWN